MERWSVEHRAFALETIFKNNDSVVVIQLIFRLQFNLLKPTGHVMHQQV